MSKLSITTRTIAYAYDGLQRLSGATETPGTTYAYSYDNAGNRSGVWLNGTRTVTQTFNTANQINGFSYDAAGNMISDGTATYGYDALGRMTIRNTTPYTYTGDGALVDDGTTRYTQDLAAPLSQILQTTQISTTDYLYGLDRLAAQTSSTKTWYVGDALGSVRLTLDDVGVPLGVVNYDPWGTPESGTVPTFGFTGELQDATTGLVNLRARWYSTVHGRFTARDPFEGFSEQPYSLHPYQSFRWQTHAGLDTKPYSQHPYQYAYSNPVLHTDPTGHCVPDEDSPRACNPTFTSSLRAFLKDSYRYEARPYRGGDPINLVLDRFSEEALSYQPQNDQQLYAFLDSAGFDAAATVGYLNIRLTQWRQDYAQRNNLAMPDLGPLASGLVTLGVAANGLDCFFSSDTGGGLGGGFSNRIGLTRERVEHILQGASRPPAQGGGHAARADLSGTLGPEGPNQFTMQPKSGKTYFDSSLSDQEILNGIVRIANDPASYPGSVIPVGKKPGSKFEALGYIGDSEVKVVVEPNGRGIVTAYPTGKQR